MTTAAGVQAARRRGTRAKELNVKLGKEMRADGGAARGKAG
jgi:hypothetical protein